MNLTVMAIKTMLKQIAVITANISSHKPFMSVMINSFNGVVIPSSLRIFLRAG